MSVILGQHVRLLFISIKGQQHLGAPVQHFEISDTVTTSAADRCAVSLTSSYIRLLGGGVLPILRYTCMYRANAPVFGHFSLCPKKKNYFLSLCPI